MWRWPVSGCLRDRGRPVPRSGTNVLIRGGVIERVGDLCTFGPVTRDADAVLEIDGRDLVALPALVEPHAHLDKALTAGTFSSGGRDLAAAIEAWVAARPSMRTPDIASRVEDRHCAT